MTIGYGHGFAVTPLHLCKAYASIVNGGFTVHPTLLKNNNSIVLKRIIKYKQTNSALHRLNKIKRKYSNLEQRGSKNY